MSRLDPGINSQTLNLIKPNKVLNAEILLTTPLLVSSAATA